LAEEGGARSLLPIAAIAGGMVLLQLSFGLCTQDDAFISFRYAANAVAGEGLVFNVGEPRVEGYTNFLWTALFIPVIAAGLDPAVVATALGILATVGMLLATWLIGGRRWLAPLLVACFPGLSLEGVQGLETAFYALLVTLALRGDRAWPALAGLAALTRPDAYAIFGVLWLLRPSKRALGIFAAFTAPHLVFRLAYYGDIVPNTFHAKVGGLPFIRGLAYLADSAWAAFPLAVAAAWGLRRLPVTPTLRAAAAVLAFQVAFVIAVGGDFKGTGRFLIPVLPAAALLAQEACWRRRGPLGILALAWALPGFSAMADFADRFAGELVRRRAAGAFLSTVVAPDRWIAVHAAGVLPYYAERPTLDMWGLNDDHIARAEVDDLGEGTAGHERHDYDYVLERAPWLILPEQGLLSDAPLQLADPDVFGPGFGAAYESLSLRLPPDSPAGQYLNLWRRRAEPVSPVSVSPVSVSPIGVSPARAPVGVFDHSTHAEQVDELPDEAEAEGEQPQQAGGDAPHVEAVEAGESEEPAKPQHIRQGGVPAGRDGG